MKSLLVFIALLPGAALAGTIDLPLPTIAQIAPTIPITCHAWFYQPHTVATGFDPTGNYVLGTADDYLVCGSSGRGGNIHTYSYCASFMWDLSGNLVKTTIGVCTRAPAYLRFTNAGGYIAHTLLQLDYGYIQYEYPVLATP